MTYKDPEKRREYDKQYYEQNREKILEREKQYYEQNREKILERKKQYREQNREKILERKKRYREQNREKIAERKKQYREQNREKIAEYREQNREKIAEREKQYYEQNREKILERKKQYREQKKQQGTAGLYVIENKKTGQVYIGQSSYIERRWKDHKQRLKKGTHQNHCLLKDYNEYGAGAFKYSVIKELNKQDFQSEEELTEHLVNEETKMILEKTQSGNQLYNLSLKPTDVINAIEELGQK